MPLQKGSPAAHLATLKAWEGRRRNGNVVPWNKGRGKPKVKLSQSERCIIARKNALSFYDRGGQPWNKGLTKQKDTRVARQGNHEKTESQKETNIRNLGSYCAAGAVPWNKGLTKETDSRMESVAVKLSLINTGKQHTEETRRRMSVSHANYLPSQETKDKLRTANKGQTPWNKGLSKTTSSGVLSQSEKLRVIWENTDVKSEWIRKLRRAACLRPNKVESELDFLLTKHFPGEWKYTGDGSVVICGLIPDFTNCNEQKKIIEVFGDYWHKGQNPQVRIDQFNRFGFACLVIWEHELRDKAEMVVEEIGSFLIREVRHG